MEDQEKHKERISTEPQGLPARPDRFAGQASNVGEPRTSFQELVELLPHPLYELDLEANFTLANAAAFEATGYTSEDLGRGINMIQLTDEKDRDRAIDLFKGILQGKEVLGQEFLVVRKDGTRFPALIHAGPIILDNKVVGLRGVATDVTAIREAQKAVRDKEQTMQLAFQGLALGMWDWNIQTGEMVFSERVGDVLGYSLDELEPTFVAWAKLVHPEDRNVMRKAFNSHVKGRTPLFECEYRVLHKSGRWIWNLARGKVVEWDENGNPLRIVGTSQDVTAYKKVEEALRNGEQRLGLALRGAELGMWDWYIQTGDMSFSQRVLEMLGYSLDEIEPKFVAWASLVHPEDRTPMRKAFNAHVKGRTALFECEHRVLHKSGRWIWNSARGKVVEWDGKGNPLRMVGTNQDVTAKKAVEEALRNSEQRLELALQGAELGMWDLNIQTGGRVFNSRDAEMLGYSLEEVEATFTAWASRVHPEDRNLILEAFNAHVKGRTPLYECEHRVLHRSGKWIWNLARGKVVEWDEQGNPVRMVGTHQDVTERRIAQEQLQIEKQRFQLLSDNAPFGMVMIDGGGNFKYINPKFKEMFGYDERDVPDGRHWMALAYPDAEYRRSVISAWKEDIDQIAPGDTRPRIFAVTCKDGTDRIVHFRAVQLDSADHLMTCEDITARKHAEEVLQRAHQELEKRVAERTAELQQLNEQLRLEIKERERAEGALKESEEKYRKLVDYADEAIFVAQDGMLKFVNPASVTLIGYSEEELLSMPAMNLAHPDDHEALMEAHLRRMAGDESHWNRQVRVKHRDGSFKWAEFNSVPITWEGRPAALILAADIDERRKTEELQLQSARFRAVADLAAGVAHNFNNYLQVVIGGLELVMVDLQTNNYSTLNQDLQSILQSSRMAAQTVRRLQSFAGLRDQVRPADLEFFDLSELANLAVEMTKTWWKGAPEREGVDVSLSLRLQEHCIVKGDKSQIFEVVLNLLKNGAEALMASGGGQIVVSTRRHEDKVILKVRDTGIGISDADLKRLFNPFFTTKAEFGAGLGLAVSRRMVRDHGGEILVESREGIGSVFTVEFPLAEEISEIAVQTRTAGDDQPLTILVVDDVEAVVKIMESGLKQCGHKVYAALSGEQAIAAFRQNRVDAVICDLGMPGMNGWEVGKRIRDICREKGVPKPPFVLLTGWGGQIGAIEKIAESGTDAVMEKPVEIAKVLEIIRKKIISR